MIVMRSKRPSVGLGILIVKDGKVLLQKRKRSHGVGSWSFPGGHLEWNEDIEKCAIREAMEEAGIKINNLRFLCVTNDIFEKEDKHYITIFVAADYDSGKIKLNNKESSEIGWFDLNNLPQPIFMPIKNLLSGNCMPKDWRSRL